MKVTKQQIIEAIRTEPLIGGYWISKNNCEVCAVGAVLRKCSVLDEDINKTANRVVEWPEHWDIDLVLKRKDWLSALSSFFEFEWAYIFDGVENDDLKHEHKVEKVRRSTIEFVEQNFPDEIEIAL